MSDDKAALIVESHDALADWLGAQPEARNVFDITDEATTVITISVDDLTARLIASGVVTTVEAHREQIARVEALLEAMTANRETLWQTYLNGPRGHIEALHQGRFDGFAEAHNMVRAALTPEGPAA